MKGTYIGYGFLTLSKLTEGIQLVFGPSNVQMSSTEKLARINLHQDSRPYWHALHVHLTDFAARTVTHPVLEKRKAEQTDEIDQNCIDAVIGIVAAHFKCTDDTELRQVFEYKGDMSGNYWEILFRLVVCCDDGHGIQSLYFSEAQYYEKPVPNLCHMSVTEVSREYSFQCNPEYICGTMANLHKHLRSWELTGYANELAARTAREINCIADPEKRQQVYQAVIKEIAALSNKKPAT